MGIDQMNSVMLWLLDNYYEIRNQMHFLLVVLQCWDSAEGSIFLCLETFMDLDLEFFRNFSRGFTRDSIQKSSTNFFLDSS